MSVSISWVYDMVVPMFFLVVIMCVIGFAFSTFIFLYTVFFADKDDYNKNFFKAARIFLLSLVVLVISIIMVNGVEL